MIVTAFFSLALAQEAPTQPSEPPPDCASSAGFTDWRDETRRIQRAHPEALAALEAWAFPDVSLEAERARQGVRTEGLVVIQDGVILYERYARGYTVDTPHLTWSMTKTFTNTLAGLAVQEGLLETSDSICDHVSVSNPDNCAVTVGDLLAFGSGLSWREAYEGAPPTTSSVVAMLYGDGIHDMAAFVSGAARVAPPGQQWQYSSGDSMLLSAVVRAVLEPAHGRDYAWDVLFDPLAMSGITWERDTAGTPVGSSYLYGPPRALARLGQLWLDDGCWAGERLLPEGWVARSTAISEPIQRTALDRGGTQGWQVWLNQPVPALGDTAPPWPAAPVDTFAAQGHWKQRIFVVPSARLVIVRVGDDRDGSYTNDDLFRHVLPLTQPAPPAAAVAPESVAAPGSGQLSESVPLSFEAGLLRIATNYGAKLACSCRYVMGQSEDYCRAWVKASPDLVKLSFNEDTRTVTARAFGVVRTTARWTDERDGCILEQ